VITFKHSNTFKKTFPIIFSTIIKNKNSRQGAIAKTKEKISKALIILRKDAKMRMATLRKKMEKPNREL
jgi:hypothetical protein